mgnify:CR=1 FL=1
MASVDKKLTHFDELMKQEYTLLHIDPRRAGVSVPENLSGQSTLTLKVSYAFQGETLRDDKQITSYLKFDGQYFHCVIPWTAIWGMSAADGKQTIWPEDAPKEILLKSLRDKWGQITSKLKSKKPSKERVEQTPTRERKSTATHLKRVK